jgi:hypothetical protein
MIYIYMYIIIYTGDDDDEKVDEHHVATEIN